jgi:hypothetical protein
MPIPAYGIRRARAERPQARRSLLEGGADPRARRSPLEGSVLPRTGRSLPEGGMCPRARRSLPEGIFEWASWWAVRAIVAWAMPCVLKRGVFGFGSFGGFKWGFPSCLRGPLGLSPTGGSVCFNGRSAAQAGQSTARVRTVRGTRPDGPRGPSRTVRPVWPDDPPEAVCFASWFDSSLPSFVIPCVLQGIVPKARG